MNNEELTICRICKENGFDNQQINFRGKDPDDRWIINNPDGSKHQHKKSGEVAEPQATQQNLTYQERKAFPEQGEAAKQHQQQQQQQHKNSWYNRPKIADVQVIDIEQGRTLLQMDRTIDLWNVIVIDNRPKLVLVKKQEQPAEFVPNTNTVTADYQITESEKDQKILSLEERVRELEPLAAKWVEQNSFKPAAQVREDARQEWTG